jgi:hypothetical protein
LENEVPTITNVVTLGMITYALNLAKSEQAKKHFKMFDKQSVNTLDGHIYWSKTPEKELSSDIELTSYGLLVSLMHKPPTSLIPVVRYLVSKASATGGFASTQSTVLGLQALSEFRIKTLINNIDKDKSSDVYNVDLSVNFGGSTKTFNINSKNSLVLQTMDLPDCSQMVHVKANGNGMALFQLVSTYNIPKISNKKIFKLSQKTLDSTSDVNTIPIRTCATYHKNEKDKSGLDSTGMTLVEANLFSGYEANQNELNKLVNKVKHIKLVEISKDKQRVVFYFTKLDHNDEICFEWKMYKAQHVSNLKPVPVKIYDYYKTELEHSILFKHPKDGDEE